MLDGNIFKEAKQLLETKESWEMTEEELNLIGTALIPLMLVRAYSDIPIDEGLEDLSGIIEEAKGE